MSNAAVLRILAGTAAVCFLLGGALFIKILKDEE